MEGSRIELEFRAKGGKLHSTELRDRRVARLVATCRELPGQRLFQYLDAQGDRHPVGSDDVNADAPPSRPAGSGGAARRHLTRASHQVPASPTAENRVITANPAPPNRP